MVTHSANRRLAVVLAAVGVVSGSAALNARAATASWAGTTDTSWANGANWTGGVPAGDSGTTANTDTATFGPATATAVVVDAGRNVQNIVLTGGTGSTTTTYSISGATLALTSGGSITATGNSGTGGSTISAPLQVLGDGGTYTITASTPGTSRLTTLSGGLSGVATGANVTNVSLGGLSTATNVVSGVISDGSGGGKLAITKQDAGTWSLTGANTFTGGVTVTGGTLVSGSATPAAQIGTGMVTLNGGTLRLSATSSTFTDALAVGANGGFFSTKGDTFSPSAVTGTGTLTMSADAGSTVTPTDFKGFAGTVNLTGTVTYRQASAFVNNSLINAAVDIGTGASLTKQNGTNNAAVVVDIGRLSGLGTLGGSAAGTGTFVYSVGARNENSTFNGLVIDGSTKTGLTKVGTGVFTLTAANSYSGLTTAAGGTLNVNGINALGGANYGGLTFNGGTLQYATTLTSGSDLSSATKNVTFTGNAGIDTNGNNVTYANGVGNNGTGGLTKLGLGTLTLAGANTYTGNTTVNAGSLLEAATGSLKFLIGASGTNTTITGTGTAEFDGTFVLDLTNATANAGDVWSLVSPTLPTTYGSGFGLSGFTPLGAGLFVSSTGAYQYSELTGLLTSTATGTPEPATLAGLALAATLLGQRRRRV